jgi:NitT/TauT family transport system permease protein
MTIDAPTPKVPPAPYEPPRRVAVTPMDKILAGPTPSIIVILAVLIALWYAAVPFMNETVVRTTTDNGDALTFSEVMDRSWSLERPVLPAPHQVWAEVKKSVFDTAATSKRSLVLHGLVTLQSTLTGFLMGIFGGIGLAIAIVHVRLLERSLMPWIVASQTVPILAVAPIIIVVLGSQGITGLIPKSIISAYLSFFPVTISMVKGLNAPDHLSRDLMRTYEASRAQTFFKLRLPASVPYLFASLKVSVAIALLGAIVGELPTGAEAGIGARLLAGSYYGQTIQIWAALVVAAVLAGLLIFAVGVVERAVGRAMGARA